LPQPLQPRLSADTLEMRNPARGRAERGSVGEADTQRSLHCVYQEGVNDLLSSSAPTVPMLLPYRASIPTRPKAIHDLCPSGHRSVLTPHHKTAKSITSVQLDFNSFWRWIISLRGLHLPCGATTLELTVPSKLGLLATAARLFAWAGVRWQAKT